MLARQACKESKKDRNEVPFSRNFEPRSPFVGRAGKSRWITRGLGSSATANEPAVVEKGC